MSKSDRTAQGLQPLNAPGTIPVVLPPDHRLFEEYLHAARGLDEAGAFALAGILTGAPNQGADRAENERYLADGRVVAKIINESIRVGDLLAAPLEEEARERAESQAASLRAAADALAERERQPDATVTVAGVTMTVADLYATVDAVQSANARAEAGGDESHLEKPGGGILSIILLSALTLFEALSLWAFAVNPSTLIGVVTLVSLIAFFAIVNHSGLHVLGRLLQAYRHVRDLRTAAHTRIYSTIHQLPDSEGEPPPGSARSRADEILGGAPTDREVSRARLELVAAAGVMGAITLVLVGLVGYRVFEMMTHALLAPPFAAGFAVLVALVFLAGVVLLAYWASRGTLRGRRTRELQAAVEEQEALSDAAAQVARDAVEEAALDGAEAWRCLEEARDVKVRRAASGLEGVNAGAVVLRVSEVPQPSPSLLIPLASALRFTTEAMLQQADDDSAALLERADARALPTLTRTPDPHRHERTPYPARLDVAEVDANALPFRVTPGNAAPRRRRVLPFVLGGLGALLVAGLALIGLVVFGVTPALATPAAPATDPTSAQVVEGEDFSFIAEVGGQPVRWACDAGPITVGLVGDAPAGSADVLAQAVAIVAEASGLPLVMASESPSITVSYVSPEDITARGSDGALGVAGPTWNSVTGVIGSAEVVLDRAAPANVPGTESAVLVAVHELAHAVGAGHARDATELMAPTLQAGTPGLSDGDRHVLAQLGCVR